MNILDILTGGKGFIKQAGTAIDSIISSVQKQEPQALVTLEEKGLTTLLDFVPSTGPINARAAVESYLRPIVGNAEAKLNGQIDEAVAYGLGMAKARIDAITGAGG